MKKSFWILFTLLFISFWGFAEKTPVNSLYQYELPNGLKLFVAENHSVPLTYIEIAVRCGAYTQTPQNAGLFHLYEHMMFKGNALYKDSASVNRAMSDMGVANWNGTTGLECVNYYFTVPSDLTYKGLEFWSYAIRTPLMDKEELESEKKVVISEIKGNASDPGRVFSEKRNSILFSDAPYTMTPSGSEDVVKNASVKQLKDIQKKFYIPNNSALFVGGDVNPDEVYNWVKEIYGTWKKAKSPFAQGTISHSREPLSNPKFLVMPHEKLSGELAQIIVNFRGPDALYDEKDTYAADILSDLMSNPEGHFIQSLVNDGSIGIPDSSYAGGGYYTRKTCGQLDFYCMVVQPELDMSQRAEYFSKKIVSVLEECASGTSEEELSRIKERNEDYKIISSQTASGLLSNLRFWWTVCDENYFYSYAEKLAQVQNPDLEYFVKKYIAGKAPLVTVFVSPEVYEATKESFAEAGFEEVER